MRAISVFLLSLVFAAPAWAAEEGHGAPAPGTATNQVQIPFVMAPMFKGDRLTAYAYVSGRLETSGPAAATTVRDKLAYIQDAFVRDVNAKPIATGDDIHDIDLKSLTARFLADARRVAGSAAVRNFVLGEIQIAPLRPMRGVTAPPGQPPESAPPPPKPAAHGEH